MEVIFTETRVALIGIIISDHNAVEAVNDCLHQYRDYIIGRMGLPYPKKSISIISIAIDASTDVINTLSGKLGMLDGVSTKTMYSNK